MRWGWLAVVVMLVSCTKEGPAGPVGSQGIQGLKGDKGDKGDQGIQGIQGIQGVAGGGWYTAHTDTYCKKATNAPVVLSGAQLQVDCDDPLDLGLSGSCYGHGRSDVYLNESRQLSWETVGAKAAWLCTWLFDTGVTPVALTTATAEICCVKHK
jgi:hypothetical protein